LPDLIDFTLLALITDLDLWDFYDFIDC